MGAQLAKHYNIAESSLTSGGPGNLWKVYSATKKSNGEQVSIFVHSKKDFSKESKHLREEMCEGIRKEAKTLAKLRHPSILHIVEPLKDDQKILFFTTEPVECSLKYLMTNPSKRSLILSELELKNQLLELLEAVNFLHSNARIVHLGLSPENIYLTADGKLKIGGFFFSQPLPSPDATISPNIDYSLFSQSIIFTPNFGFTAPEVVKENLGCAASDAFSLGCLIFTLLQMANKDTYQYFFDVKDVCTKQIYLDQIRSFGASYTANRLAEIKSNATGLLSLLLAARPEDRFKLQNAHDHPWFNDPKIKTLEYLDHLKEKEPQHQLQFLTGLTRVLGEFDPRVTVRRILPKLAPNLTNDKLSAHVLPPLVSILERPDVCSKSDFYKIVWPHLKALCTGKEISAQTLHHILKSTELWIRLLDMQDFQSILLVLYEKGIVCGIVKIQELVIQVIPKFAKKIEYATLKTGILPRVIKLASSTSSIALKMHCMESIANFAGFLDMALVKESLLPSLEKLSKTDTDGKLHLAMVKIVESFLKIFSCEELATRIIPLLLVMSIRGQFTKNQFSDVMRLIRRLIDTIDSARSQVTFPRTNRN